MSGHVARCVGCGRAEAEAEGGRLPVDWTLVVPDGAPRTISDFCCGDCLRQSVQGGRNFGYAERFACVHCDGALEGCGRCEGGLMFSRADVAKKVGAAHPATTEGE